MTKRVAPDAPSVVRLSGPGGLIAAVPQFLGFHPSDSLVVLCLRAPRGRVAPVIRSDLFPPDADEPVRQLVGCAVRHADSVAVVCYHDGERPECLDVLLRELTAAEVPITCVLSVREGLIRDASSPAAERAAPGIPVPGEDDEQARRLAAASVMAGRQVLPDREALRASIAPPAGRALESARWAINRVCDRLADDLADRPVHAVRSALPARIDAAFRNAVREHADSGRVADATAAELIVLAGDVTARDLLVARAVAADDPDIVAMLISVVGRCPDEDAPEICCALAVAAYRYGDGALAQCAVDRVLSVRPDHRLAHLMLSIMAAGLPPGELVKMADVLDETLGPGHRDEPDTDHQDELDTDHQDELDPDHRDGTDPDSRDR